jgi:hypothetical protein
MPKPRGLVERSIRRYVLYVVFGSLAPLVLIGLGISRRLVRVLALLRGRFSVRLARASQSARRERENWTREVGLLEVLEWLFDRLG